MQLWMFTLTMADASVTSSVAAMAVEGAQQGVLSFADQVTRVRLLPVSE